MRRRASPRDERGAVAITMAVILCFVMIPIAALVVDIGVQRVARSDMQAVADTVALDMSRRIGSATPPTSALAQEVAARTVATTGEPPVMEAHLGYIPPDAGFVSDQSLGCGPTRFNSYFTDPTGKTPNAVLVVATTSVDFSLRPSSGGACRSAIAGASEGGSGGGGVCYDVGSLASAVSLNRANVVNKMFNQMVQQLQLFSNSGAVMSPPLNYQRLAQTQVSLDEVADTLGFDSVNSLAVGQVRIKDFFGAVRTAMVSPDTTNQTALQTLRDQIYNQSATFPMSKLLTITPGAGLVTGMDMTALDLVAGALTARANDVIGSTLSIDIAGSLPGLVNNNGQSRLIQGPHRFCGAVGEPTSTTTDPSLTEQLRVEMTATLSSTAASFSVPDIPGLLTNATATTSAPNNWSSVVSVAPTTTTLKAVECSASVQGITVDVQNGAARVTLKPTYIQLQKLQANVLGKGMRTDINGGGNVSVEASITSANPDFSIRVPGQSFDTYYPSQPTPQVTYTVTVAPGAYVGYVDGLSGAQQQQILAKVMTELVRPMFNTANPSSFINTTINPILALLGAEAGGTTIALSSKPPISCGGPPEIRG